jgi:hypothetical protein
VAGTYAWEPSQSSGNFGLKSQRIKSVAKAPIDWLLSSVNASLNPTRRFAEVKSAAEIRVMNRFFSGQAHEVTQVRQNWRRFADRRGEPIRVDSTSRPIKHPQFTSHKFARDANLEKSR